MQPTIDTSSLQRTVEALRGLPAAAREAQRLAVNAAARRVQQDIVAEMADSFDRPTPRTLGATFLSPARPNATPVQAVVGVRDYTAGSGRAPITWLRWQIYGGPRAEKGFERLLVSAGAMRSGDRAVPGRFARLDAYGNISPGQLVQILSQLRIDSTAGTLGASGSTRSLPRFGFDDTRRDRRRKAGVIRRAYQRAGGQFVAFPNGRGKLRPGIYRVRATAWGRSDPQPVLLFVGSAVYEPGRFDFHYAAGRSVARHLPPMLQREVDRAIERSLAGKAGGAAGAGNG